MTACGLHPTGLYTLQLPNLKTEERAQGQWQRHFCFIGWRESHIPEASSWSNTPLCTHEMASREQRPTLLFERWGTYVSYVSCTGSRFFTTHASLITQLVKNLPANARDPDLISGLGSSPGEGIGYPFQYSWASLVAQMVKNLPAMWETWSWSLG